MSKKLEYILSFNNEKRLSFQMSSAFNKLDDINDLVFIDRLQRDNDKNNKWH